ncbi:MAG: glycosyltransferase [Planctomycetota bacterium]|nr:glycosyltransferase [Planctomycetota bacterium]
MSTEVPLLIAHVDAERGFSGGEVQVFLLLEGLRSRGHRCVLVAPPGSRAEAEAMKRGFETRAVPLSSDLDLRSVVVLRRELSRLQPDLVHLHTGRATWLGGLAAWRAGVPAITTRRMDRRVSRGLRTRLIYGKLVQRAAAISPAVARCLTDGGVDAARITLVPSAIDPARIRPHLGREHVRAELGAGTEDVVLLSAAALVARKGLDVLIEALARLDQRGVRPRVWLAGEGEERADLQRRIEQHGLEARVRLLGRREDIGDLLAGADVFVLPARREGLGVAALEAMSARRPVVASRIGGLAEAVVDGRTGLLVPPDDAVALASALERVVLDPVLRDRLGSAGPGRVSEGFLPEQMVAAYERMYREVLAECSAARKLA